jgi:hypothetical protein
MPYKNKEQLKIYNRMYYKNKKQNINQSNKSNTDDDDIQHININKSNDTDPAYVFNNILKNTDTDDDGVQHININKLNDTDPAYVFNNILKNTNTDDDTLIPHHTQFKFQKNIHSKTKRNRFNLFNQYIHTDDDTDTDDELEPIDDMSDIMPRFIRYIPYNLLQQKTMDLLTTLDKMDESQLNTILHMGNILFGYDTSRTKMEFYYFEVVCAVKNLECNNK